MSESESRLDPGFEKLARRVADYVAADLRNDAPIPHDWYTTKEAAEYLRTSEGLVTKLRLSGDLKCFQPRNKNNKGSKGVRFHRVDHLEFYLRAGVAS